MIAALYVQRNGAYFGLADVDPWDEARDARRYAGPYSVVAHPPCSRWCRLAGLVEARWGYKRGDDGGCFAAALASVRQWGGVLEHPAHSDAWPAYGLPKPSRHGGWSAPDAHGGRACHVEQSRYGHRAKKATWLYAIGVEYPELRWGSTLDSGDRGLISWCGNHTRLSHRASAVVGLDAGHKDTPRDERPRLSKREASATPPAFKAALLAMARSVY